MNIKKTVALWRVMDAYAKSNGGRGARLKRKLERRIRRHFARRGWNAPDIKALRYDWGLYGCIASKYGWSL